MKIYLPTREECQELVKNTEVFYCTKRNVNGFEVELWRCKTKNLILNII
jgi:hypothetical protein